ncbi:hypothetical protein PCCS19_50800 [Paenibacillus sp. CCS19]|uniref:type II toxin-antitoxin system SpoIISA family toxin n=1 Tax=Paenibacillus sp. CCS19 TaxID=3158387 RepID=UPI00256C68CE|nr:type II toxin-antitoxin system SpoIISA family toxin [Paenibacillus cellulosilyticus]GMK42021.1 hypothetical protein PCCS19_50800 [Paenibacillus cellulosilyticus]
MGDELGKIILYILKYIGMISAGFLFLIGLVYGGVELFDRIDWISIDPHLLKLREAFKNGGKVFFGSFFLILMGYLIHSVQAFRQDPNKYTEEIWKIRKTYYAFYMSLTAVGFVFGYIDYRDWKLLLQLTALVVFSDIAVFQTPNITKIWSAEFQHNAIAKKAIEGNMEQIESTSIKLSEFSEVVRQTNNHFAPITANTQLWADYEQQLRSYLNLYTNRFRYAVHFFPFTYDAADVDMTKQNISQALDNFEVQFGHRIDPTPGRDQEPSPRGKAMDKLVHGNGVFLDSDKLLVVPIFFHGRDYLIGVKASQGLKLDPVDNTNLVNLCRIFQMFIL